MISRRLCSTFSAPPTRIGPRDSVVIGKLQPRPRMASWRSISASDPDGRDGDDRADRQILGIVAGLAAIDPPGRRPAVDLTRRAPPLHPAAVLPPVHTPHPPRI